MEKIVTKIGDVTIERRVSKAPKFPADAAVRGSGPQTASNNPEDTADECPEYGVLNQPNPNKGTDKQCHMRGIFPVANSNVNPNVRTQMGKGFDARTEMEQKITLPKGISWRYKPSEQTQKRLGNWGHLDDGTGTKNFSRCDDKNSVIPENETVIHPEGISWYRGISIERKRSRPPTSQPVSQETSALYPDCTVSVGNDTKGPRRGVSVPDEGQMSDLSMHESDPEIIADKSQSSTSEARENQDFSAMQKLDPTGSSVERARGMVTDDNQFHLRNHYRTMDSNQYRQFASKSPIQISSDEEKQLEDVNYDMKEVRAVEGRFDNDKADYGAEDEKVEEMEDNVSALNKNHGFCTNEGPARKLDDGNSVRDKFNVKTDEDKGIDRNGSPIVLSSEDDEKNDTDVIEVTDVTCQSRNSDLERMSSQRKSYVESTYKEDTTKAPDSSLPCGNVVDSKVDSIDTKSNEVRYSAPEKHDNNNDVASSRTNVSTAKKRKHNDVESLEEDSVVEETDGDCTYNDNMRDYGHRNTTEEDTEVFASGKSDMTLSSTLVDKELDLERKSPLYRQKVNNETGSSEDENTDKLENVMDSQELGTDKEDGDNYEGLSRLKSSSELDLSACEENFESDGKEASAEDKAIDGGKSEDMNDLVCDDLMELMKKGEIEGEVEDDKDQESEEEGTSKKSGTKRKAGDGDEAGEEEGGTKPKGKKKKVEKTEEGKEKEEGDGDKNIDKSKVTSSNLRKNIREVMDETKLDEATLSAQRQEAERLKRLQEQQRIIRELQKQIVLNRQNQKSQSRVLSLLQGNSQTSILKTSSSTPQTSVAQSKSPNHVLVKLSNGQQTSLNNKKMMELLKNSKNKVSLTKPSIPKTLLKQGMVSPSVSIAPIVKKEIPVDDKKKKKGDVVTLSSDSEDDCIVLSEEDESEPEEDPTNSGMHTSDKYNVPDDQGRVVVNVGHPEAESDIYLAPQIARIIKPHQIGGIRFLYDNVIESTERFESSTGFGCILAHSMGLGKTLQIVSFSDIFLRYTSAKTILCIMPINTIQNWLAEFNMWLPKENNTDQEVRCREFDLYIVNESLKNINARSKVILDWQKNGGVLLMGYELFRLLSLKKACKSKKKKKDQEEKEDDAKSKELIEEVYAALVRPGPDLVICDEGHRIKNSHATTSQALKQIRTKRRIVLTGYPLQNNLLEYWCMVDFVRPNYLGSKTEFSNMFERPIQNGQCIDSTPQDKRLMRYRAHVLHSLLEGFVQRRSHAVLQSTLPEKEEYVLLLRFTPFQRKLYDTFMNEVVRTVAVPNPLKAFAVCCKIWNHPDVLYNFLKKKGEEIDLDLEEALAPPLQPSTYPFGQPPPDGPFPSTVPGWPQKGPGSRNLKNRSAALKRTSRGRKPAAAVTPNLSVGCEKKDQNGDGFNASNYAPGFPEFAHQTTNNDPLMESDRSGRGFGARSYNQFPPGDFGTHSNFSGTGYEGKNPLENLEDLSSGDFQNKRFYRQSENSIQTNFSNSGCLQPPQPQQQQQQHSQNSNFSQNVGHTNNADLNSGFGSGITGTNPRFNQSDPSKSFDYNSQEYNSDYYSGANFQNQQATSNFGPTSKLPFNRNNPPADSNSFYPNARYMAPRGNSMGFNVQAAGSNIGSNYQNYSNDVSNQNFQGNLNKHYPNSDPTAGYSESACRGASGLNYQNTMSDSQRKSCPSETHNRNFTDPSSGPSNENSDSNYQRNDFQGSSVGCASDFSNNYRDSSNFNCRQNDSVRDINAGSNYSENNPNFGNRTNFPQGYWSGSGWSCGFETNKGGGADFKREANDGFMEKYSMYEDTKVKSEVKQFPNENAERNPSSGYTAAIKSENNSDGNSGRFEGDKGIGNENTAQIKREDDTKLEKKEDFKSPEITPKKEDQALPYDWATDLFKSYVTGIIENSSKMEVFFHILTESIKLGDRLLVFSQSLLTLDLIEDYLHRHNVPNRDEKWAKQRNYFRLDGSTPGLEREKLINEFNSNPNIIIFLVSTRAGSLGINLVGANRVVVFDASWNPCHDTQAVCRVYRYGQQKPCFVYRLVMDSCLEKKIYDRQINKQGMADRVVDELNPDAHLSIKEVTNLCWDDQEDTTVQDFAYLKDKYNDQIIKVLLENCSKLLSKEPFQHESLLIDRKEKKLSQAEKRLAKRSYELEKQAANQPKNIYSFFPNTGPRNFVKPIASVRPMQNEMASRVPPMQNRSKWIPAEVWQKQGMSAQEMTLPLDVVIPTNAPDKTSIVLKAGQRVMVLKSPKGIYMQLENGKIIAIRTAFKVGQGSNAGSQTKGDDIKKDASASVASSLKNNPNVTITSKSSTIKLGGTKPSFVRGPEKKLPINFNASKPRQILGKAKPFLLNRKFQTVTSEIKNRLLAGKTQYETPEDKSMSKGSNDKDDVIITNNVGQTKQDSGSQREVTALEQRKAEESAERPLPKGDINNALETLRKVTENIKEDPKTDNNLENPHIQRNSLKNYRHNFSSQAKGKGPSEEEKDGKTGPDIDGGGKKVNEDSLSTFNGNENVQNWLMNQPYPPMDPYGNYFPGYYSYGHGSGPMMNPYEGFYPNSYGTHMGSASNPNSSAAKQEHLQSDISKATSQQQNQHVSNTGVQHSQNATTTRASSVNSAPVYSPYPNPYQYPYNFPNNPGFGNQSYPPFPAQNQSSQKQQQSMTSNSSSSNATTQSQPYDSSMYSAFHLPDGHFQGSENPYPPSYHRPPYPNSATTGFFPYNAPPYRSYADPNYPYAPNFNPYMHHPSYGYPMQNANPTSVNSNQTFNQPSTEPTANSS